VRVCVRARACVPVCVLSSVCARAYVCAWQTADGSTSGPAQSLRLSYRGLWQQISGVLHAAGKATFMNCNTLCRVDLLAGFDGLFSEGV
jgi:hypothetical protein